MSATQKRAPLSATLDNKESSPSYSHENLVMKIYLLFKNAEEISQRDRYNYSFEHKLSVVTTNNQVGTTSMHPTITKRTS